METISVIVPRNPFAPKGLSDIPHYLCALDVEKLMEWWPGLPHVPKRDPLKIRAIQRSLDWKRVAQIAAYLLQSEIDNAPEVLDEVFGPIYEPSKNEPGREWPPKIRGVTPYQKSSFPFFTNVLVHVNGAHFRKNKEIEGTGELQLDPDDNEFYLTVIDGQHRINGAYLALCLHRSNGSADAKWDVPAEVFVNLDPPKSPPVHQAQIFIDVNLYQKKVDRSLVADLFPLARGYRDPLDTKDRAQDIGRKLMLETGPLVGMIQIPGIKYGVKDVVTLATLNSAIEGVIPALDECDITNLEAQVTFLAQALNCWLSATGRAEPKGVVELDRQNVVYQGRVLVSAIDLVPVILLKLKERALAFVSESASAVTVKWLRQIITRAGLMERGRFITKDKFKKLGFLGSGGIGRFRDRLWAAAFAKNRLGRSNPERIASLAQEAKRIVQRKLAADVD